MSYELSAANEVRRDPAKAEHALSESGLQVRHAMRRLRTLLIDLAKRSSR